MLNKKIKLLLEANNDIKDGRGDKKKHLKVSTPSEDDSEIYKNIKKTINTMDSKGKKKKVKISRKVKIKKKDKA